MQAQKNKVAMDTAKTAVDTATGGFNLHKLTDMYDNFKQQAEADLYGKNIRNDMDVTRNTYLEQKEKLAIEETIADIRSKRANANYTELQQAIATQKLQLNKAGLDWKDPLILRFLANGLNMTVEEVKNMFGDGHNNNRKDGGRK